MLIATVMSAGGALAQANVGEPPNYIVRGADPAQLERDAPELPDVTGYTAEAVSRRIGDRRPARVGTERMVTLKALDEFTGGDQRLAIWAARQSRNPQAIVIRDGYATPADLASALDPAHFEQTATGVFVARLPILVAHDATLHIDAATRALRLSEDAGSFLVNDGRLFITDSALVAWRESTGREARFRYDQGFRPFVLSWGGTETYVVNSRLASLGYDESKSYGFSISQYTADAQRERQRGEPTGWVVDSTFDDMWFGFYCYEARDIAIVGNTYRNNLVYGIDPHDYSHGLIVANNTVTGTRRKHGIIISREVNDSWLFGNTVSESKLSGMVLDRQSSNNVVAGNQLIDNGADGLTIYESPDNLIWENRAIGNASHGFRVRNSTGIKLYHNVAISNGYTGINGHAKRLSPADRNLQLDPYSPEFSMIIVGGRLVHNNGGPIDIAEPLSIEMAGVELLAPANERGVELSGVLGDHLHQVLDLMVRQKRAVVIEVDNMQRQVEG